MRPNQRVKWRKEPGRALRRPSPKNYETRKMERNPNKVCNPDGTAVVGDIDHDMYLMPCHDSLVCVSCRAFSQTCSSPEEDWVWEHPALHLQEHTGAKSALTDETGEASLTGWTEGPKTGTDIATLHYYCCYYLYVKVVQVVHMQHCYYRWLCKCAWCRPVCTVFSVM